VSRDDAFMRKDLERVEPALHAESRVVRFQDVDAAGIIFYPRVLEYFSDAYVALLLKRGYDLPERLLRSEFGAPLVHAEADYFAPLRFGDRVDVAVVKARVSARSFRLGYRIRRASGELASLGQTVHVCIDRQTFASRFVPDDLRRVLEDGPETGA
jgi:1,4-dihydroxy-2-naphthoyl-CoA hydrolase